MPFADVAGIVAGLAEDFSDGDRIGRKRHVIQKHTRGQDTLPGHQ
jgi:hypothetical protein